MADDEYEYDEFVPGCHFEDHCYYLNSDDGSCDHCGREAEINFVMPKFSDSYYEQEY